eukprot:2063204-Rhodomonas_salina.3
MAEVMQDASGLASIPRPSNVSVSDLVFPQSESGSSSRMPGVIGGLSPLASGRANQGSTLDQPPMQTRFASIGSRLVMPDIVPLPLLPFPLCSLLMWNACKLHPPAPAPAPAPLPRHPPLPPFLPPPPPASPAPGIGAQQFRFEQRNLEPGILEPNLEGSAILPE